MSFINNGKVLQGDHAVTIKHLILGQLVVKAVLNV